MGVYAYGVDSIVLYSNHFYYDTRKCRIYVWKRERYFPD